MIALNNELTADYVTGIKKALGADREAQLVKVVSYDVANPDVSAQLLELKDAGVTAVISNLAGLQGVSAPKYLKQIGWKPIWFVQALNSSRTAILEPAGLDNVKGFYSTQWAKDPADARWADDPAITRYREVITKHASDVKPADDKALFGYAAGQAFADALKRMKSPTRAALVEAIDSTTDLALDTLLPGVRLNGGAGGRLVNQYQISQFDGEQWQPVGDVVDISRTDAVT